MKKYISILLLLLPLLMEAAPYEIVSRLDSTMRLVPRDTLVLAKRQPEPYFAHCSHRLFGGAGVGYGAVKGHGQLAAQGDVNYAFFWNDNWGISLGLGLDYYRSERAYADAYDIIGYIDSDNEPHTIMHVNEDNMQQGHKLLVVEMPLMLQMEYRLTKRRKAYPVSLYGSLGTRIGYPVTHMMNRSGDITTKGYYEKWQLNIHDLHEYGTTSINEREPFPVKTPAITPQTELGVALPVTKDAAIGVGLYGNISTWNEPGYLPWQAGVKVSVRWRHAAKTKPKPAVYRKAVVKDTIWVVTKTIDTIYTVPVDTIEKVDTIVPEVKTPAIDTSYIWFEKDSIQPKLTSEEGLDHLAAELLAHPDKRIVISGHTCDLGSYEYNLILSRRRAQTVADLLLQRGVPSSQIQVNACSYSLPYRTGAHNRSLDRRVEIILL